MINLSSIVRPDIAALEAYTPIVPLDVLAERLGLPIERLVKLDANENPYGPSPQVIAAIDALGSQSPSPYAIYPDPDHTRLRAAIAAYVGVPPERLVCGAGSDELIDLIMRLVLRPGEALLDCPPTFGMYAFGAGLHAARVVSVARDACFDIDTDALADAAERERARLLFLAAPNNPTGNHVRRADVERLLELPLLLVVDEAYYEFSGSTVADLTATHPNLIVLRTFSKWAGLAGMRVGYAIGHEALIPQLWKIKQPYNITVASETAAIAALADGEHLRRSVDALIAERERLAPLLGALPGFSVLPSAANYLLCQTGSAERARQIYEALRARGVLIRYFNKPRLTDCIRISIGTPEQNARLLEELQSLV